MTNPLLALCAVCLTLLGIIMLTLLVSVAKIQDNPHWVPPYTFRDWLRMFT